MGTVAGEQRDGETEDIVISCPKTLQSTGEGAALQL